MNRELKSHKDNPRAAQHLMPNHKTIGDTCGSRGFPRASGENPNSSFFILHSRAAARRASTATAYSSASLAKLSGKSLEACKCAIDEGRVGYVELCSEKKIITVVPEDEAVLFCAQFAPARRVDMLAELLAGEPRAVLEAVFFPPRGGGKKNEERRTGIASALPRNPLHPQAFPKVFMMGHKANGKPRENIGKIENFNL